jgi:hypothetical protein
MKIPITFKRNGATYQGTFNAVSGGGGGMFHLMIDDYYHGCLIKTQSGWQFTTQKEGVIRELGEYFGMQVEKFLKIMP